MIKSFIVNKQFSFLRLIVVPLSDSVERVAASHEFDGVRKEKERLTIGKCSILISLPTGTKIFNWLSTYLGNPPLLNLRTSSALFGLLFLLMFTIGGSSGIILGNAAVDLALHDTYYVPAHFHFVLSLGAVIAMFSSIIFNGEKILGSQNLLSSSSSSLSIYHFLISFIGILLTFSPMHFLGFNLMPRRIPDFPDSFHSWNFLSSIGSGITFLSFAMFSCFFWMDSYCVYPI